MQKGLKVNEVRFRLSDNDLLRLDEQCRILELPRAEVLRYYIRQGYEALGGQAATTLPTQPLLFNVATPTGGKTTTPPIPKAPPQPIGDKDNDMQAAPARTEAARNTQSTLD